MSLLTCRDKNIKLRPVQIQRDSPEFFKTFFTKKVAIHFSQEITKARKSNKSELYVDKLCNKLKNNEKQF